MKVCEQVSVLGSISNLHWFDSKKKNCEYTPKKSQYFFIPPDVLGNEEYWHPKHFPASPRHQILFYFYTQPNHSRRLHSCLLSYLSFDRDPSSMSFLQTSEGPQAKRRRYCARTVSGTAEQFVRSMELSSENLVENVASSERGFYEPFMEQLVSEGLLQWRKFGEDVNVVVMSDYCESTGKLLPLSYVHVTAIQTEGSLFVKCTCKIHKKLMGSALRVETERLKESGGETFLEENFTCMHCRCYRDELHQHRFSIFRHNRTSHLLSKFQDTCDSVNNPVVLLGAASLAITTKLSVLAGDSCALVHINFTDSKNCFARCQDGKCEALHQNRSKLARRLRQKTKPSDQYCPHIQTLQANSEFLREVVFPDYFLGPSEEDVEGGEEPMEIEEADASSLPSTSFSEDQNLEDLLLCRKISTQVTFNRETGLWECNSATQCKPKDMQDPELVKCTGQRLTYIHPDTLLRSGFYKGPDLIPSMYTVDGSVKDCPCHAGFLSQDFPQGREPVEVGEVKVYCRDGALLCKKFQIPCVAETCFLNYQGQEDCLFFGTQGGSGVGQEIFWDFVSCLVGGKFSFTKFCQEKTRTYLTTNQKSAPFLSNKTFIDLVFAWIVSFRIDFRQEIDPWCSYHPKMLACDGTKVGVAVSHQKLDPPMTQPDVQEVKETLHKKLFRCLLPYPPLLPGEKKSAHKVKCDEVSRAKRFLRLVLESALKSVKLPLTEQEEMEERLHLFNTVGEMGRQPLLDFLSMMLNRDCSADLYHAGLKLLNLFMTGDDAVSSILPFRFHSSFEECCECLLEGHESIPEKLETMNQFAVEVSALFKAGVDDGKIPMCVSFIADLILFCREVHSGDPPAPPPEPKQGTYYPPGGTAYYFTPHGNQVRDLPNYNVHGEGRRERETPACEKDFPTVSKRGFGYMFLFFCPDHGHCYGFHLIDKAEGRKDPFCAMFKFMEQAPEEVFYDFACQLSEYTLNREPSFFRCTRFWHDLFHGVTHICGDCFKSDRIHGLKSPNTEICEQFNSYLQCMKFTGSHMSQEHFMLFAQFMIYRWNKDKTVRFESIARVALGGLKRQ